MAGIRVPPSLVHSWVPLLERASGETLSRDAVANIQSLGTTRVPRLDYLHFDPDDLRFGAGKWRLRRSRRASPKFRSKVDYLLAVNSEGRTPARCSRFYLTRGQLRLLACLFCSITLVYIFFERASHGKRRVSTSASSTLKRDAQTTVECAVFPVPKSLYKAESMGPIKPSRCDCKSKRRERVRRRLGQKGFDGHPGASCAERCLKVPSSPARPTIILPP